MFKTSRRFFLKSSTAALAYQAIPSGKQQVVLDTDTYNEIDDQFAVAYAILSPEAMDVEAIYAAPYHNDRSTGAGDGMQKSYDEILRVLKLLKRDSKLAYKGSSQFMTGASKPVDSPAARDLIAKALKPRTAPLYVLTVGAPTNVSSAILMEPKIKDKIVVVWLGGQPFDWPTAREFNLFQDIHASRVLYDSGVPLVDIPTKNVSEHIRTTDAEMAYFLKGKSPLADFLYQRFHEYAETHGAKPGYPYSKVIWDISTVAWLVNPKWVPTVETHSPILEDGFTYRRDPSRHKIRVATNCQRDQIFDDFFKKLNAAKV